MAQMEFDRRQALVATAGVICGLGRDAQSARAQTANGPLETRAQNGARPLIPRRLLFGDLGRSVVRISPDGRRVAFLAPLDGVLNLWVGPIDDIRDARPLTRVSDRDLGPWLQWLHNNRHLVFFREQGGDENWQAHRIDVVLEAQLVGVDPLVAASLLERVDVGIGDHHAARLVKGDDLVQPFGG